MSSIDLVSLDGSSMITAPNLQARYSTSFVIDTDSECGTTAYNPAANRLAEAFNKIIIKVLKKFISSNKWDWNEKLSECLWAYRTIVRTPIGNTPFSLVYRCEAVIPLEIQMPSLRVALMTRMTKEDNDRLRLEELKTLDKKWLQA